jgi:ribosomal protein S2
MTYLLTAIGLTPAGSCTVHIYTQTIQRTTQNKQYIEQHKNNAYIIYAQCINNTTLYTHT